jgi:hypothetical protein
MLHHLPTADGQDRLLAEAARVLAPGGLMRAGLAEPRVEESGGSFRFRARRPA